MLLLCTQTTNKQNKQRRMALDVQTTVYQEDGIVVVDVDFKQALRDEVRVSFRNFYAHRFDCLAEDENKKWKVLSTDIQLMPCPHHEDGAQDLVHLHLSPSPSPDGAAQASLSKSSEAHKFAQTRSSKVPLTLAAASHSDVVLHVSFPPQAHTLRLILTQPSPLWKAFGITHLKAAPVEHRERAKSAQSNDASVAVRPLSKHPQLQAVCNLLSPGSIS